MLKQPDEILSQALIERGLLSKESLESIAKGIDTSTNTVTSSLIKQGVITEREALNIIAQKLGLNFVNLKDVAIDKSVVQKVPVAITSYYKFMPVKITGKLLTIAVSWPQDLKTLDAIRTHLGSAFDLETVLSCQGDILDMLRKYYGLAADILEKIVSQAPKSDTFVSQTAQAEVEDIEKLAQDASVINLVNQIILEAHRKRATDIHIEPFRQGVALRYRIDGVLYDADTPAQLKNFLLPIISRIKIMSNLNIVERRLPQDGRGVVKIQDQILDLRISTLPTPSGESVVVRILPMQMLFSLEKLGLDTQEVSSLEMLIEKPYGIIFVTGPTGSGKTTTLYTCLSKINTRERKIITVEDPIEYELKGVTQIQVMPEIGMDFARALRSMLRHDPDVMMVGEVRDLETAEIAIRVALTGHLVFSTLHTNDAASGITRLIDIGIEPYLVASSVETFIAQRLVRVICPYCKVEDTALQPELRKQIALGLSLNSIDEVKIYRGKGCHECNSSGFVGRTAIYEILLVDEEIKELITKRMPSNQIKKIAMHKGMLTLRQDGWKKVISGSTTPEEVMKVTPIEEYEISMSQTPAIPQTQTPEVSEQAKKSSVERRVYDRLERQMPLRYKTFKSQEELFKGSYTPEELSVTENISAGGLLFFSNKPILAGSFLELTVELPDNQNPITCLAKVLRVEEIRNTGNYEIGICFLDIAGADRLRLNNYVVKA
jgi:type II secretory ATPase GspE/PulE/Tfp pilus assembly ATPase PilB-like protein